jgi:hypothetical protein
VNWLFGKSNFGLILLLMMLFGCVKDNHTPQPDDDLPGQFSIRLMVRLPATLIESSGLLAFSDNKLWTHNDSGNSNELFCIDTTAQIIRTLLISNAQNHDREDLAIDTQGRVYICDTGNNNNNRTNLAIYRIPNPEAIAGNTVTAEIINYSFEDQTSFPPTQTQRHYDVEAVVWKSDSFFLFTKDRSSSFTGITKLYSMSALPGYQVARLLGQFFVDETTSSARITAADINLSTGELVLLTHTRILSFSDYPHSLFFKEKLLDFQFTNTLGQAEAIAFFTKNKLYVTEEGASNQAGYLYEVVLP